MKNVVYSNVYANAAFNDLVKENKEQGLTPTSKRLQYQQPSSSASIQVGSNPVIKQQLSRSSTPKSNKPASAKDIKKPAEPQQTQESAVQFYQKQCKSLKAEIKDKDNIIASLKADNEHLRTLNLGYVHQINEVIHKKVETFEKLIIDKSLFESVFKSSEKQVIQRLEINLQKVEQQLRSFIKHCRVMEADIEVYKKKIIDADVIVQGLKNTGEFSIQTLVERLKQNDDSVQEYESENRRLQYENCLIEEKIRQQSLKYGDIENNYEESKAQYQELVLKHNRTISENEERKNSDHKIIYNLKCQNDYLEHQLRTMQNNLESNDQERLETNIKVAELSIMNDTLRSTFMNSKRNSGGFNVQFKPF